MKVNLVIKIKRADGKWNFAPAASDSRNRTRWGFAIVNGQPEAHPEGTYYLDYRENGKRRFELAGKIPAEVQTAQRRRELAAAARATGLTVSDPTAPAPATLPTEIAAFLKANQPPFKAAQTARLYTRTLTRFAAWARTRIPRASDVTREHIRAYAVYLLNDRPAAPRAATTYARRTNAPSVCKYLRIVVSFLHSTGSPIQLKAADMPRHMEADPEAYTREEIAALFRAMTPEIRFRFYFLLCTGFRQGEAAAAWYSDVNFAAATIRVKAKPEIGFTPKDKDARTVPVPRALLDQLRARQERHPDQRDIFPGTKDQSAWIQTLKWHAKKAGLDPATCWTHKFRDTFATWHLRDGIDVRTVQKWLGHSKLETTMRYLAAAQPEEMQEQINSGSIGQLAEAPAPQPARQRRRIEAQHISDPEGWDATLPSMPVNGTLGNVQ